MGYNKCVFVGRVAQDPEVRTNSDKVSVSFSLAVNRKWTINGERKEITDFIPVVAFGKIAEILERYLTKGRLILIDGRLTVKSFDREDGSKGKAYNIVCENWEFLDSNSKKSATTPDAETLKITELSPEKEEILF